MENLWSLCFTQFIFQGSIPVSKLRHLVWLLGVKRKFDPPPQEDENGEPIPPPDVADEVHMNRVYSQARTRDPCSHGHSRSL